MNIDFSLVLVILAGFTGLVSLIDVLWFKPKRKQAVEGFRADTTNRSRLGASDVAQVEAALAREPWWIEYPKSFFPVLLVVLLLRSFLVEPFKIPSGSMLPTLKVGDFILVNKFTYGLRLPVLNTKILPLNNPERGDVLVFKYPENRKINYIKRVVGLPGDKISYLNKQLKINGELVSDTILEEQSLELPSFNVLQEQLGDVSHLMQESIHGNLAPGEWEVPEGHYFVMGDNRDNSRDSRIWGYVPDSLVVGRAFAVWMSLPGWVPSFSRNGFIQ